MKQATLRKFGFTRRVEHRGEEVYVNIPDYVEETGIPCPDCKLKFKNKRALGSHTAFKHGKYGRYHPSLQILLSKTLQLLP